MINRRSLLQWTTALVGLLGTSCGSKNVPAVSSRASAARANIVGAWHLQSQGSPILHHMLCFHADGIVASFQADGGFPNDSESDGAGAWQWVGTNRVKGVFMEFCHDRTSHDYLGYVQVDFEVALKGDIFSGNAITHFYDAQNTLLATVTPTWSAVRVLPGE